MLNNTLAEEFANEQLEVAVDKIDARFRYFKNHADWRELDCDSFEICDVIAGKEHLFMVIAEGEANYGEKIVVGTSHGAELELSDHSEKVRILFFIDKNENGEYILNYYLDNNGEIDVDRSVVAAPDFIDE